MTTHQMIPECVLTHWNTHVLRAACKASNDLSTCSASNIKKIAPDVYACTQCRSFHLCGDQCTSSVDSEGFMVCTITGRAFSRGIITLNKGSYGDKDAAAAIGGEDDELEGLVHKTSRKKRKKDEDNDVDDGDGDAILTLMEEGGQEDEPEASKGRPAASSSSAAAPKKRSRKDEASDLSRAHIKEVTEGILKNLGYSLTPGYSHTPQMQEIVKSMCDYIEKLLGYNLQAYFKRPNNMLTLEGTIQCVLYFLSDGMYSVSKGVTMFPRVEALQKIPGSRQLSNIYSLLKGTSKIYIQKSVNKRLILFLLENEGRNRGRDDCTDKERGIDIRKTFPINPKIKQIVGKEILNYQKKTVHPPS